MLSCSTTRSCWTTASAPSGTTPPVAIPIASPGASDRGAGDPGGDAEDDRQRPRRVRRAEGVAVHRRARKRREVDQGTRVLGEDAARRVGESAPSPETGQTTRSKTSACAWASVSSSTTGTYATPVDTQVIAGRYRLERRLGAGGMSEVWAAQDLELDRTVAVKLLAPDADPARFEREARAAAGLSHPNICALYDYGEDGRRRYMVLEYLPGGTLEERLGRRKAAHRRRHRADRPGDRRRARARA